MKPKFRVPERNDLMRLRLADMIDMRHELVKLAELIDWDLCRKDGVPTGISSL